MSQRAITLTDPAQDVVWVPLISLPWRDDEQDRKPTDTEKAS